MHFQMRHFFGDGADQIHHCPSDHNHLHHTQSAPCTDECENMRSDDDDGGDGDDGDNGDDGDDDVVMVVAMMVMVWLMAIVFIMML